ncbi:MULTISPECIES: metal-dependent hydrolase family protein [Vibrio]|uniref:metal-dependent hydrolase family protein n=1 Tax=Vibrio TaxID=662 RepID=UPI001864B095|nr:amidohydrolase family protein [Vibrio bathopelagicus]MBY7729600.1 amidohydrolase family protein [Vibrio splendidus]
MKHKSLKLSVVAISCSLAFSANAASTLFTNVDIFNGTENKLYEDHNVLVVDNKIEKISKSAIDAADATVVDGQGKTMIPGLIDMHSHLCIQEGMLVGKQGYDQMAMGARTYVSMNQYLEQGFTTARDAGCNILGVAKAVNNGLIDGPRIYPSGGFLSQTGGHADTGNFNDQPGAVDDLERHGFGYIVDGKTEVRRAARQNLRAGATQIKVMAGGGVASEFDPIHMTQMSVEELETAVEVAKDYGTYVTVHAYHDRSVNRAIDAGVRTIEHNFLVSEDTIKRMKKEGVALSAQAVMSLKAFAEPESITFFSPDQKAKASKVYEGALQMFKWAKKHDILVVTGGDMFGPAYNMAQAENMTYMQKAGFTPFDIMKMGTSNAAEVLSWSGGMNPYKYGSLGKIEAGAYADLILVDGNPLDDIEILNQYEEKFQYIMKDGKVYKDTL